ncbi:MAG: hypothetical protein H7338_12065 [Candidatus Sericytochromatia bacterium]|nr:hypothetical protein [Candidatus Sericytochromatia bacterium]
MQRFFLFVLVVCLTACQSTVQITTGGAGPLKTTARIQVTLPIAPLKIQAQPADVHHLTLTMYEQGTPATPQGSATVPGAGGGNVTATFTNIPVGTYRLSAEAFRSSDDSVSISQGGAITSTNTAVVAVGSVTYNSGAAFSLPLLELISGATVTGTIFAPMTASYGLSLVNATGAIAASFDTVASTFRFKNLPDGTYRLWSIARNASNGATPARAGSTVTVSAAGTSVTGSFTNFISGMISPLAGGGPVDGGIATSSPLAGPWGIAADTLGNLFVADLVSHRIRMLPTVSGTYFGQAMSAGKLYTVAGNGTGAFGGDGGPATSASLQNPTGVAVATAGNLYIAGRGNFRVRMVPAAGVVRFGQTMTAGKIYTITGVGNTPFNGDNIPAGTAAVPGAPRVAVDPAGTVYIADSVSHRIRLIAATTQVVFGQAVTAGRIYTLAGTGSAGSTNTGALGTTAQLNAPHGIALDSGGNLFIADRDNNAIRMIAASATSLYGLPRQQGFLYTVAGDGTSGYGGDGALATAAQLFQPYDVAVDATDNVLIADTENSLVRVLAKAAGGVYGKSVSPNCIYSLAGDGALDYGGDGGPPGLAQLNHPRGLAVGANGSLAITDWDNSRVRILTATGGTIYTLTLATNTINTIAGNGTRNRSGDGDIPTLATFANPAEPVYDAQGNLFVADRDNNSIRVIAAQTGTLFGQAVLAGKVYTVAGSGTAGFSGDGATARAARLNQPVGLALDTAGNLYVADSQNHRVRAIAASTGTLWGQPVTAGAIITVAGTGIGGYGGNGAAATAAQLSAPADVVVDSDGNLLISDTGNNCVRLVAAITGTRYGLPVSQGNIHALIGPGGGGPVANVETATVGTLSQPQGLALDRLGNLVIADSLNRRVRCLPAVNGTLFGQTMTLGNVYVIAGNGASGYSGDGVAANTTSLTQPQAVCLDPAGCLYIADFGGNRIRLIEPSGVIRTVAGDGTGANVGDGSLAINGRLRPLGLGLAPGGGLAISSLNLLRRIF